MRLRKRIVILTSTSVQHRYVAGKLSELPGVVAIVAVTRPKMTLHKKFKSQVKRFGLLGTLSRASLAAARNLSGQASQCRAGLERVLDTPNFPAHVPVFQTTGVNSDETRALLHELDCDILCVYGTHVVADRTLSAAKVFALNLHTGISPRYRGADCEFWPIHNGEPQFIGVTVHSCTSALDGGAIFATARARLEPGDRLGEIFGRCVAAGAGLYHDVVQKLVAGEPLSPEPQDHLAGREYKVAMRGWMAELKVLNAIRSGLIRHYVLAALRGEEARDGSFS
jgi:methionyl-tRNA formyltransferase